MTADNQFTAQEKLSEISREIALRRRVYPKQIADGRMTRAEADRHLAIMAAIARDYGGTG